MTGESWKENTFFPLRKLLKQVNMFEFSRSSAVYHRCGLHTRHLALRLTATHQQAGFLPLLKGQIKRSNISVTSENLSFHVTFMLICISHILPEIFPKEKTSWNHIMHLLQCCGYEYAVFFFSSSTEKLLCVWKVWLLEVFDLFHHLTSRGIFLPMYLWTV